MTYDPYRIEISTTGEVTRGGKLLGTMVFASIAARMDATGEHYTEEAGPEYADELEDAERGKDDAEHSLTMLQHEIRKAIADIDMLICGNKVVTLKAIRAHLEEILP